MEHDEWKPYPQNRIISERQSGFLVIKPTDASDPTPVFCQVCSFALRTQDDTHACETIGCCARCAVLWAYPNKQAWNDGWRPSADQIRDAEHDRLPLVISLDV
jgi:hypothetical protein